MKAVRLVGSSPDKLLSSAFDVLDNSNMYESSTVRPPLWDGKTAPRIVDVLRNYLDNRSSTASDAGDCTDSAVVSDSVAQR